MSGQRPDLDALVARGSLGDEEALASLYRELSPPLLGFLRGLAPEESEDLASETWIAAAGALAGFEGDGAGFRRLLFTIARRRAIDHLRKRSRRRTAPLASPPEAAHSADAAAPLLEEEDAREAIERIFALLPRPQAEVVVLRVVGGLSVADVATVLGRSPASVSVLQSRGLRRLATKLGRHPRSAPEFGGPATQLQDPAPFERRDG
jgi:RNA polymerase sigma-70 factor (ECF subfamily)